MLKQKKVQDQKKIADYRKLVKKVLDSRDGHIYDLNSLKDTTQLLQANPEYNAAWNYRRDIIVHLESELDLQFWGNELLFTLSQLRQYPKVYWIWNHRLWVLSHHLDSSVKVWEEELQMVSKLLVMDARNFHGWLYRRIIVKNIERITGRRRDEEELAYTTENINKNISNFSAWHQRTVLLSEMFARGEIENETKFIQDEFSYITNAMFTDAEDQSVWFYIKWFIKNSIVYDTLESDEYISLLQELRNNITVINQDDFDFSGKQNNWCLKILIVLNDILKDLGVCTEIHNREYLAQLIEADPLRKKRYLYLLNKTK